MAATAVAKKPYEPLVDWRERLLNKNPPPSPKPSGLAKSMTSAALKWPSTDKALNSISKKTDVPMDLHKLHKWAFSDQKVSWHTSADGVETLVMYLGPVTVAVYSTGSVSASSRQLHILRLAQVLEVFAKFVADAGTEGKYGRQSTECHGFHTALCYEGY